MPSARSCRCRASSSSTSCFRLWCSKRRCSSIGSDFEAELPLTLTLAFVGVGIAAAVVAAGMHMLIGWSWIGAALVRRADRGDRSGLGDRRVPRDGLPAAGVDGGRIRKPAQRRRRRRRLRGAVGDCRRRVAERGAASSRRSCGRSAAASRSALRSAPPSSDRRPHQRSAGRDHADDHRRLRLVPHRRAFPRFGHHQRADRGIADRQLRNALPVARRAAIASAGRGSISPSSPTASSSS